MCPMKARGALKTEEKEFIERAKRLSNKPALLLPACALTEKCRSCPFDKVISQLNKIQSVKDDPGKLKFQSKWAWNTLVKAYAGFILLPDSDKNLIFLVANLPAGKVTYVANSRAPKEKMIGVQHYDDLKWRLMAFVDYAKQGYNLYSTRDGLYCTGQAPKPPAKFIKEVISRLKYTFKSVDKDYRCQHLTDNDDLTYIKLNWISAGITFSICENCCSNNDNLFCKLSETYLSSDPRSDFVIDAKFGLKCIGKCDTCSIEAMTLDSFLAERYLSGELSDKQLVTEYTNEVQSRLGKEGKVLFIAGSDCYGTNVEQFISALNPSDEERAALKAMLTDIDKPILLDSPTPGKVLAQLWSTRGVEAIEAVVENRELAEEIYKQHSQEQPSQVLKDAWLEKKKKGIMSTLPQYKNLPPIAKFADNLARVYRIAGEKECLQIIEKTDKKEMKIKATAFAFLLAFGLHEGKQWQYSKEEKDFAGFLQEYARALLDAEPEKYHDALQNLLTASGAGEEIHNKE